jgi:hypothetical protein
MLKHTFTMLESLLQTKFFNQTSSKKSWTSGTNGGNTCAGFSVHVDEQVMGFLCKVSNNIGL